MITLDPIAIFTGLSIGLVFGFALSKSKLCTNSAFANFFLFRSVSLIKIITLSVLLMTTCVAILAMFNLYEYKPMTFSYILNPFGGFIFGIGMVLASGCASGICYKAGEGLYQAIVALFGFMITGLIVQNNSFINLSEITGNTLLFAGDFSPSIPDFLGLNINDFWIIGLIIGGLGLILFGFWEYRASSRNLSFNFSMFDGNALQIIKNPWPWWIVGTIIAIVGMFAFLTRLTQTGVCNCTSPGLGMTNGIVNFFDFGWATFLVIGTILGAVIASKLIGHFRFEVSSPRNLIKGFTGGSLMGAGAVLASGCNIGHIFGGLPHLSIGSVITIFFMIAGNWTSVILLNKYFDITNFEMRTTSPILMGELSSKSGSIVSGAQSIDELRMIDTRGETCPIPLMLTRKALRKSIDGEEIIVIGDHRPSLKDIPEYIKKINSEIINLREEDGNWYMLIKYHKE
ncbi:MAG: Sulfurtransferase TusA [Candidatus Heimdallarchaeota archaeon LC_3]|nr:MAG: Sulfurtransferase TusA [Candidatus Heimdallarchaeota archaeon LC_3]